MHYALDRDSKFSYDRLMVREGLDDKLNNFAGKQISAYLSSNNTWADGICITNY
jgi:hypothetical protein